MKNHVCINLDCGYCDAWSETGCCADLSTWEDCDQAEFDEEEEEDEEE